MTLVKDVTYTELQKLIYEAVKVSAERQKIRVGFPPKLLQPAAEGQQEVIVPLNHGDKIALEVLPDFNLQQDGKHNIFTVISNVSLVNNLSLSTYFNDIDLDDKLTYLHKPILLG